MLVPSAYGSAYRYVLQGKKTRARSMLLFSGEDQLQALVCHKAEGAVSLEAGSVSYLPIASTGKGSGKEYACAVNCGCGHLVAR